MQLIYETECYYAKTCNQPVNIVNIYLSTDYFGTRQIIFGNNKTFS